MSTRKPFILILFFILTLPIAYAQNEAVFKGSVKEQLNILVDQSFPYDRFKDIRPALPQLRKNVLDSIAFYKDLKDQGQETLLQQRASIDSLHKAISEKDTSLQTAIADRDHFSFLGIQISKSAYNLMVWGLIIVLVLLLLFFINRYKNNISVAKESKTDLENLKEEYEAHRKKAMEREQKLKRDLQDELNKSIR